VNDLHFGFVVGINKYPGISDLNGPVADARAFREWLLDPAGGATPEENVHLVAGEANGEVRVQVGAARPTRSDLVSALFDTNEQIKQAIGDDPDKFESSRLYVFLAGHGIAPGTGGAALLPANARRGLYGENLAIDNCRSWYEQCGVVRQLVIFCDFCRNRISLAEPGPLGFNRCTSSQGQVETFVGYAAAYDRPAYEEHEERVPADERRGYFSRALMEGLRGAGAQGEVTSETVAAYVRQRVRDMTADRVPAQEARFPNDLRAPLRFGGGRRPSEHPVTIEPPSGTSRPLRLVDHKLREIAVWRPGQGPWTLPLADGLYAVVPVDATASRNGDETLFKIVGEGRHVRL
jgi:hypothetical protein